MTRRFDMTDGELLADLYPEIYHVTDDGNGPGIIRHGLRSTQGLLEPFEVDEEMRREIVEGARQRSYPLKHAQHGHASVRDQLPLSLKRLAGTLTDMSLDEWLALLNSLCFFWPTTARVETLLSADAYVDRDHDALVVDAAELVRRYEPVIRLAPLNTGATRPFARPRGSATFQRLGEYPLHDRLSRVGRAGAVAEITVPNAVPDISEFVLRRLARPKARRDDMDPVTAITGG